MRARGILFLILMGVYFAAARPGQAQAATVVTDLGVAYTFGQQITFRASVQSESPIEEVRVFFQSPEMPNALSGVARLDESGLAVYQHDLSTAAVRAFSEVAYWFAVTLEGGQVFTSERFSFLYQDSRFEWQTLTGEPFRVHWYQGNAAFAQLILDTAQRGLREAVTILDAARPEQVDIYVYANPDDYALARDLLQPDWVGGHTDPAAGVIVVPLLPGEEQRLEVERKIPHEVAHIVLYQYAGSGYANLPTWLNEGFASRMELNPNPDYLFLIQTAQQNQSLLPISSLCDPFPRDASGAVLAYAESTSFVRYLERAYGPAGIRALVRSYSQGASCENGPRAAPFDTSLSQLEQEWRSATFSETTVQITLEPLVPWLVLAVVVLAGPLIAAVVFWVGSRGNV